MNTTTATANAFVATIRTRLADAAKGKLSPDNFDDDAWRAFRARCTGEEPVWKSILGALMFALTYGRDDYIDIPQDHIDNVARMIAKAAEGAAELAAEGMAQ